MQSKKQTFQEFGLEKATQQANKEKYNGFQNAWLRRA